MNFPHARDMSRGPFFALIAAERRDLRHCGVCWCECAGAHRLQWEGLRHDAHHGAGVSKSLARRTLRRCARRCTDRSATNRDQRQLCGPSFDRG